MTQITMIDQMREADTLDGFEVIEHVQEQGVSRMKCMFCGTIQERPFSSVYQYFLGQRSRIPCTNRLCNTYRKHYKLVMPYPQYLELMEHGCRLCGAEVAHPRDLCRRCQNLVNRFGGEPALAKFILGTVDHTKNFTLMWDKEEKNGTK